MPTVESIREAISNDDLKGFSGLNSPNPMFADEEDINDSFCDHDVDAFTCRGSRRTSTRPDANRVYTYDCTVDDCDCTFQTWEEWR